MHMRNDFTPTNPLGVILCGIRDSSGGGIPEPVHYDCKGCKKIVHAALLLRAPVTHKGPAPEQIDLFDIKR